MIVHSQCARAILGAFTRLVSKTVCVYSYGMQLPVSVQLRVSVLRLLMLRLLMLLFFSITPAPPPHPPHQHRACKPAPVSPRAPQVKKIAEQSRSRRAHEPSRSAHGGLAANRASHLHVVRSKGDAVAVMR